MKSEFPNRKDKHIAIVGGGVAGSTAAIHFAELGFKVSILEKGVSLVNGPPICHLHAGGNLYREISEQQCLDLLTQSIDTIRLYPHSLNIRPTIIAVPHSDGGDPEALLPRLEVIKRAYQSLVEQDTSNQVLGEPDEYYKLYSKEALIALSSLHSRNTHKALTSGLYLLLSTQTLRRSSIQWSLFRNTDGVYLGLLLSRT